MSAGLAHGDRVLCLHPGQRRGKHGTCRSPRRHFAICAFDDGLILLVLTAHLHPIPRRPPPDF